MTVTYDSDTLPNGWIPIKLRHLLSINPPVPAVIRGSHEEVSFLPMELIGEDGSLDLSRTRPVQEVLTGYSYYANGDVLFAKVTPCFENGKGALVRGLPSGYGFGTTEVTTLRPGPNLDQAFLGYLIRSDRFRQSGIAAMTGAGGLKRVPDEHVREFRIALPPLTLQKQIVAFLDRETGKIDTLIAKQEQLIATLREDRTATIAHAVTKGLNPDIRTKIAGVDWLDEIPAHWEMQKLKRICTFTTGWTPASEDDAMYVGDNPWANISDLGPRVLETPQRCISDEAVRKSRIPISPKGSLLFSFKLSIGQVSFAGHDMYTNEAIATFRESDNLDLAFGYYSLPISLVKNANENIYGAKLLNQELMYSARIPLPPLSEQRQIATFLDNETVKVDALIAKSQQVVQSLREYRVALITDAVTGRIDVRGAA